MRLLADRQYCLIKFVLSFHEECGAAGGWARMNTGRKMLRKYRQISAFICVNLGHSRAKWVFMLFGFALVIEIQADRLQLPHIAGDHRDMSKIPIFSHIAGDTRIGEKRRNALAFHLMTSSISFSPRLATCQKRFLEA